MIQLGGVAGRQANIQGVLDRQAHARARLDLASSVEREHVVESLQQLTSDLLHFVTLDERKIRARAR
ncbi:MAG TPA: hypothetical protein VGD56_00075, partial [Gemmatirosa sp.]